MRFTKLSSHNNFLHFPHKLCGTFCLHYHLALAFAFSLKTRARSASRSWVTTGERKCAKLARTKQNSSLSRSAKMVAERASPNSKAISPVISPVPTCPTRVRYPSGPIVKAPGRPDGTK